MATFSVWSLFCLGAFLDGRATFSTFLGDFSDTSTKSAFAILVGLLLSPGCVFGITMDRPRADTELGSAGHTALV